MLRPAGWIQYVGLDAKEMTICVPGSCPQTSSRGTAGAAVDFADFDFDALRARRSSKGQVAVVGVSSELDGAFDDLDFDDFAPFDLGAFVFFVVPTESKPGILVVLDPFDSLPPSDSFDPSNPFECFGAFDPFVMSDPFFDSFEAFSVSPLFEAFDDFSTMSPLSGAFSAFDDFPTSPDFNPRPRTLGLS